MLTNEEIQALLEIDTDRNDNRYLRLMSSDNPIKDIFIYHLVDTLREYNVDRSSFEENIVVCICKYDADLNAYLNGKADSFPTKDYTVKLNKEIIANAIKELFDFYVLLDKVICKNDINEDILTKIKQYRLPNYVAILQVCGLIDVSGNVYRSKILSRFLNIKQQVVNYSENRMNKELLVEEFKRHLKSFSEKIEMIKKYDLLEEDFLVYVILFDTRQYKNNRRYKSLKLDH